MNADKAKIKITFGDPSSMGSKMMDAGQDQEDTAYDTQSLADLKQAKSALESGDTKTALQLIEKCIATQEKDLNQEDQGEEMTSVSSGKKISFK